ncbi:MAG: Crp/Fnr family transcriptional regulator [Acidimicrobiia bacterium]
MRVAEVCTVLDAPSGHVLVQPNSPGSGLFVIEEGTVTVEAHGEMKELGEGEVVGELALLTEQASRVARVSAKTDLKTLAIPRAEFLSLLESEPQIAISLLKILAARLAEAGL